MDFFVTKRIQLEHIFRSIDLILESRTIKPSTIRFATILTSLENLFTNPTSPIGIRRVIVRLNLFPMHVWTKKLFCSLSLNAQGLIEIDRFFPFF